MKPAKPAYTNTSIGQYYASSCDLIESPTRDLVNNAEFPKPVRSRQIENTLEKRYCVGNGTKYHEIEYRTRCLSSHIVNIQNAVGLLTKAILQYFSSVVF